MATLTEKLHAGAFLVQEMPGYYSRDTATVALSQTVVAGQVMYSSTVIAGATSSAAADAGNTGNGVLTLDVTTPVLAGAKNGVYRLVCLEPGTNVGTFAVYDPDGVEIGRHVVAGAAFSNQIKFTIADGATDFVAGDAFSVTVGVESGTDQEWTVIPNDGTQTAGGIAIYPITTDGSTKGKIAMLVRNSEVRLSDLTFASGISAANKAKAIEDLRRVGIICR